MKRKHVIILIKLAVSIGIMALVYRKVMTKEGADEVAGHLSRISWPWIGAATTMLFIAIAAAVWRWDLLLRGQGIIAPKRHLLGSFMIGRFFGAFTPGGLGLQGYKLYDIASQTGKSARSTAVIGIEMVLGQLAFGAVVIAGSIFGLPFLGVQGVLLVDAFFLGLITVAIVLITKPTLFRMVAARLPQALQQRVQTTVDAVCAYEGRGMLVTQASLLGMAVHAFNNLIYVCTARALGLELSVGQVFFASGLQIFSTLLPASSRPSRTAYIVRASRPLPICGRSSLASLTSALRWTRPRVSLKGRLMDSSLQAPACGAHGGEGQARDDRASSTPTWTIPRQMPPHVVVSARERDIEMPRVIADYIAGMTDRFALEEYAKLYDPYERV